MAELDNTNAGLLQNAMGQVTVGMSQGQAFVSEQARLAHLRADREVGMREATASQELRQSAQAREILQSRAASGQPQAAP